MKADKPAVLSDNFYFDFCWKTIEKINNIKRLKINYAFYEKNREIIHFFSSLNRRPKGNCFRTTSSGKKIIPIHTCQKLMSM